MTNSSTLKRIFTIQEQVVSRHIAANSDRFAFISEAVELLIDLRIPQGAWESIPVEMRSLFNYLYSDAFSTLISAIRVCLHGCDTDAFALMRVVLEELTILDYIATKRLYHSASIEIQENTRRGKPFSDRFSYQTAVKALGITDRRERLRGQMSSLGSHASPPRLSLALTRCSSGEHFKAGVALDNPKISIVLGEIASLCLFTVRVVNEVLRTYLDVIPEEFSKTREKLEEEYKALKHSL
jgi:hypothetical protein